MTIDPRTPVIVGVAQVSHRPADDDGAGPDPIDLMTQASRDAAIDSAAATDPLASLDAIAVIGGLWRYKNPGASIAAELELGDDVHTILTTFGGNLPIQSLHTLAERIQTGTIDSAILVGGECNLSRRALAKVGKSLPARDDLRVDEVEHWGPPLQMGDETAMERGGETPRNSYAILDSAVRASRGESLDEARDRAAFLWSGYAAVAADNPHAADRQGLAAEAIRTPTDTNRMVSWPYTKAMCANNTVDQAAAILICSEAHADALGVPAERRVYPHLCVNAADTQTLLDRERIEEVPGLRAAATELRAAIGVDRTIDHVELYSCFPSIVTVTTEVLGIDPTGVLTVTGGLAFAGAPLNFAAGQGLVGMVDTLRADPGSIGLVQGNGGHASKHALGVYSTTAPESAHEVRELGSFAGDIDIAAGDRSGAATLRGVTVEYERSGPTRAIAVVEFDDGSRNWAVSDDPAVMNAFTSEEMVGRTVQVDEGIVVLA